MRDRIMLIWNTIIQSYWFIPSLMLVGVLILLKVTMSIDSSTLSDSWAMDISWLRFGSVEGARQLLSSIVGSLITVIGLLFSMTMVVFTLASSQYGPQVMRHFMGDRVTQFVLGTLVSTFIYCLLVLRNIGNHESGSFVPHISVSLGLFLTLGSLCILIYFIHHVTLQIQPHTITRQLANELIEGFGRVYPIKFDEMKTAADRPDESQHQRFKHKMDQQGQALYAKENGYVQAIALDMLAELVEDSEVYIELDIMPGDLVTQGQRIGQFVAPDQDKESTECRIREACILGAVRTVHQDNAFAIQRIVSIAVRALSPGLNEPFVSILCIDYLTIALQHLSERHVPSGRHFDSEGQLKIVSQILDYGDFLSQAFDPILHFGESYPKIKEHIVTNLKQLCESQSGRHYQSQIQQYVESIS